jgi:hypothetical protein
MCITVILDVLAHSFPVHYIDCWRTFPSRAGLQKMTEIMTKAAMATIWGTRSLNFIFNMLVNSGGKIPINTD